MPKVVIKYASVALSITVDNYQRFGCFRGQSQIEHSKKLVLIHPNDISSSGIFSISRRASLKISAFERTRTQDSVYFWIRVIALLMKRSEGF